MKKFLAMLMSIAQSMCKVITEHVVATIGVLVTIICLVVVYCAFQQGIIDDDSEEIVEIPFGK